ncbi:MAG: TetR/AcrR family transcriptional regulator [Ilumatobacteraceae bacterium]|nr:TetR/AcrR family transcriptional regulator [Ilumatobacteraceae bacterium]
MLEDTTGIDRSTLYKSFGGKDGLYASAADAYIAMATEQLFSVLHDGDAGVADILAIIDTLAASHRAGQPRGCDIVNDIGSVGETALPTVTSTSCAPDFGPRSRVASTQVRCQPRSSTSAPRCSRPRLSESTSRTATRPTPRSPIG